MITFKNFFSLELKLLRQRHFYATVLILLIISVLSVTLSIIDFQATGASVYQRFIKSTLTGVPLLSSIPVLSPRSASSIFFAYSGTITDIFRFSHIVFYLGSLLALLMGLGPYRHSEFFKMTASRTSIPATFIYTGLSRLLIMVGLVLSIFALTTGIAVAALPFSTGDFTILAIFGCETILLLSFFFSIGCCLRFFFLESALGSRKSVIACISIAAWILLTLSVPSVYRSPGNHTAGIIPYPESGEPLPSFVTASLPPFLSAGRGAAVPLPWSGTHWPFVITNRAAAGLSFKPVRRHPPVNFSLSHFFPASFYKLICADLSNRCRLNTAVLFCNGAEAKSPFFPNSIRRGSTNRFATHLTAFPTGDSRLSGLSGLSELSASVYLFGSASNLLLVIGLMILSFVLFNRKLAPIRIPSHFRLSSFKLDLYPGQIKSWIVNSPLPANLWFNLLSGRHKQLAGKAGKDFHIDIRFDDADIVNRGYGGDFFYICHPSRIPGQLSANDLCSFFSGLQPGSRKSRAILDSFNNSPNNSPNNSSGNSSNSSSNNKKNLPCLPDTPFREMAPHRRLDSLLAITCLFCKPRRPAIFILHDPFLHYEPTDSAHLATARLKDHLDRLEENDDSVILLAHPESMAALGEHVAAHSPFSRDLDLYYLTAYHQRIRDVRSKLTDNTSPDDLLFTNYIYKDMNRNKPR